MVTTSQQKADRRANAPIFVALVALGALVGAVVWALLLPQELAAVSIPRVVWGYISNPRWRALIDEQHVLAPLWLCISTPAVLLPFAVAGAAKSLEKNGA